MNAAYQLHQFEDTGYGLEIRHVQPDAGQRIRLARLRLHRRYLPRIVAGVVAGTVHRHHGLRHHVTPIRTLGFTTRARVHARPYLCSHSSRSERRRGVNTRGSKMESRTEPVPPGEPIAGHLLCVFTTARAHGGLYHCALPTVLTAKPLFPTVAATLRPLPTVPDQSTKSDKFGSNLSDLVPRLPEVSS